ncbi:MAG: hypothetical protein WCR52_09135 [Bacteroidota bacterium]|uniref:hypothetical protein n=1 Tax=Runella sp. TaxID=1960881 RepID=UPI003017303C
MKKITISIMAAMMLLSFMPKQLNAETPTEPTSISVNQASEPIEVVTMRTRLDEINTMDKSNLSLSERKQLRKEVRGLRSHLREINGGVYLSVGAIIIIVLLLILLL